MARLPENPALVRVSLVLRAKTGGEKTERKKETQVRLSPCLLILFLREEGLLERREARLLGILL